jgi:hypothetical protein
MGAKSCPTVDKVVTVTNGRKCSNSNDTALQEVRLNSISLVVCENGNNAEPISISECAQGSVTAAVLVVEVLVRVAVFLVEVILWVVELCSVAVVLLNVSVVAVVRGVVQPLNSRRTYARAFFRDELNFRLFEYKMHLMFEETVLRYSIETQLSPYRKQRPAQSSAESEIEDV